MSNPNFVPIESSQSYDMEIQVRSNKSGARKVFKTFTVNWGVGEIWPVMREKIRPHLSGIEEVSVDLDDANTTILLKPSTRATVKDFVALEPDDFVPQVTAIWKNIQRGGRFPANWKFVIAILGNPVERNAAPIRSSANVIAACANEVRAYNEEHNANMGESSNKLT